MGRSVEAILTRGLVRLASIEPYEASYAETERILYSKLEIEQMLDSLTPQGNGGLMSLSTTRTNRLGSEVEHLAIKRARLSSVLDALMRVYRGLPRVDKLITRHGYWHQEQWERVADRVHMHTESVRYRRKRLIIPKHQRALALLGEPVIRDFWRVWNSLPGREDS